MKPIAFHGQNHVYGANQPQYKPLPVRLALDTESGLQEITSLWQLSWKERVQVLLTGKVWHRTLKVPTSKLQPVLLAVGEQPR